LHHYSAYTYQDLLNEKSIIFYILLDEAMIIQAQDYYDRLYASVFSRMDKQTIKKQLRKVSNIINQEDKEASDIMKDRQQLRELLKKSVNKRPQRESDDKGK
jgi:ABC-type Fe3+-hydroxamate transport system substrate-binding protein